MSYRRYQRYSKPVPRNITVKYASNCLCCGKRIEPGEWATYYPIGTIRGESQGKLAHLNGVDGNSLKCAEYLREKLTTDASVNDYAGDGLDARYEDDCRERCGL